jgi:hypothetical protein
MKRLWYILGDSFCDPCISRIDKILAKFCPKFLDLYASIYGTCVGSIVNKWKPFTMLVDARLVYISVDGLHYSSGGQVLLTVNLLASLHLFDRPRDTPSNRDRTRPNENSIITIAEEYLKIEAMALIRCIAK